MACPGNLTASRATVTPISLLSTGSEITSSGMGLSTIVAAQEVLRLAKEHLEQRELCYVPFRRFALIGVVRLGQLPSCFREQWQCFKHCIDLLGYPALRYSAFNNQGNMGRDEVGD
jgi:hypothetical protein